MAPHSKLVPVTVYLFLAAVVFVFSMKHYIVLHSQSGFVFDAAENKTEMAPIELLVVPKPVKNVQLLVLVSTVPEEYELRRQIRQSWGNVTEINLMVIRVEFFMGRVKSEFAAKMMEEESAKFGDVVIADFEEDYFNLGVKTFAMLSYKASHYSAAKCFVKADIDNVLWLRNFARLCEETVAPAILGKCDVSRQVQRDVTKWAVPNEVWPDDKYPPYCSTGTYVMAGSYVPKLLVQAASGGKFAESANFRKLPEDVIFTGILAEAIKVRRRHIGGMSFTETPQFICRSGCRHAYSIHMIRHKNHIYNFKSVNRGEGKSCHLWDVLPRAL